ncbi:uncharacterized protein Z518_11084 [Rhinocladiella mackenziei CBS 650.93]|uniref:Uncharacterized protein n=1 Tax=Rhinocladiella mackenziei CBS 650.93 TaxID=1442369 RepID=A0A0D2FC31_9EURO|nr:uncharacterized protein Z518_11084 [Rhinocladiella mackenziei CBS 650.93]KIW99671.1 hypothetical protein Z518_11084 [Rhinocladiella mackenziei CBS 650.93]
MSEEVEIQPIPSVKDLASSEPFIRRSCLKDIIFHLNDRSATAPLTLTQCLQLWRGLYVALYMHDSKNAISVQNLTAELAGTVRAMFAKDEERGSDGQTSSWLATWASAFWATICREWASIDQWRMNKVLLLVRFFLRETFNVILVSVSKTDVDVKATSKNLLTTQITVLETWPLSPRDRKVPDGLRLHVLDIWVDELAGQIGSAERGNDESKGNQSGNLKSHLIEASTRCMTPVENLSKEALSKGVKLRAKDALKIFQEKFSAS